VDYSNFLPFALIYTIISNNFIKEKILLTTCTYIYVLLLLSIHITDEKQLHVTSKILPDEEKHQIAVADGVPAET
jgi:hypothetical protein